MYAYIIHRCNVQMEEKGPERMCQMELAGGASNARGENPSEIEVSFLSLACHFSNGF